MKNGYDHSLTNNTRSVNWYRTAVLYKIENQIRFSKECDELRKIFSYVRAERNNDSANVNVSAVEIHIMN